MSLKHKNITHERNLAFYSACLEVRNRLRAAGQPYDVESIIDEAIKMPPKLFYVSYDTAARALHRLDMGGFKNRLTQQFWQEFARMVAHAVTVRRMTRPEAITFVLCFGHPSRFFITKSYAKHLYNKYAFALPYDVL